MNSFIDGFVVPNGRPKYVKGKDLVVHPRQPAREDNLSSEIFIGTITDLVKFTFKPVA